MLVLGLHWGLWRAWRGVPGCRLLAHILRGIPWLLGLLVLGLLGRVLGLLARIRLTLPRLLVLGICLLGLGILWLLIALCGRVAGLLLIRLPHVAGVWGLGRVAGRLPILGRTGQLAG